MPSRCLYALATFGLGLLAFAPPPAVGADAPWTFVSIPDFLNGDIDYPEPGWDGALDFVLDQVKAEDPEFVLVAGDMVNGRWWRSASQVDYMADRYYGAWKRRMEAHGLGSYYVAVGDHEVGDNPWAPNGGPMQRQEWNGTWDCAPLEFIPLYKRAFVRNFSMPINGPEAERGTAYYVEQGGLLVVTLDVFDHDLIAEHGQADVTQSQLEWLDRLLTDKADTPYKIVQGHTPIVGPVNSQHSSKMMLKEGADSALWKLLVKRQVDAYFCGEVHAVTCLERDGVLQVSHGGIVGWADEENYLVGRVTPEKMTLTIKEIPLVNGGTHLPQSAANEPRELVSVSEDARSSRTIGTIEILPGGVHDRYRNATGCFDAPAPVE